MKYKKLFLNLGISLIIMYSVMFFNVDKLSHIYLSTTRLYMAILMVASMAVLMVSIMWKSFENKKANIAIIVSSILIFIVVLALLRTQVPIGDEQYMKAMIPHHSSAILTSQEANIQNPEVKELAEQIIETQIREINLMKELLNKTYK